MQCGAAPTLIGHVRVMFSCGIHRGMAEHIRYQIDIAGCLIKIGGKGGTQLVRADGGLQRGSDGRVFFDHFLYRTLRNPAPLKGQEESVLMARQSFDLTALLQIICQSFGNLWREIQDHLIAALAGDQEGVLLKIHIVNIDAYQLGNTDAGAQKQRQDGKITPGGLLLKGLLRFSQTVSAFCLFQNSLNLFCIQTDDRFFVDFRKLNQFHGVVIDALTFVQIIIHGSQRT